MGLSFYQEIAVVVGDIGQVELKEEMILMMMKN
jgi:hypothetical protein